MRRCQSSIDVSECVKARFLFSYYNMSICNGLIFYFVQE